METWNCLPPQVTKGGTENIREFSVKITNHWNKKAPINDKFSGMPVDDQNDHSEINEQYFKHIISKLIVFNHLGDLISQQSIFFGRGKNRLPNPDGWYDPGKGIRAGLITYSIAKLVYDLRKKDKIIDFDSIWKIQNIPEQLGIDLLVCAKTLHSSLIIQSAKKIPYWLQVQKMTIPWPHLSDEYIIPVEEYVAKTMSAKEEERASSDKNISLHINRTPLSLWQELKSFLVIEDILEDSELKQPGIKSILEKATTRGRPPLTSPESNALLMLYSYAVTQGYKEENLNLEELIS
jgi:hypothetical protein